jgi:hypothetical protein
VIKKIEPKEICTCDYGDTDRIIDYLLDINKKMSEVIDCYNFHEKNADFHHHGIVKVGEPKPQEYLSEEEIKKIVAKHLGNNAYGIEVIIAKELSGKLKPSEACQHEWTSYPIADGFFCRKCGVNKSEANDFKVWALEQFENIKGCHMDCNGNADDEHKMFHIADEAIDTIRRGKWSALSPDEGVKCPEQKMVVSEEDVIDWHKKHKCENPYCRFNSCTGLAKKV